MMDKRTIVETWLHDLCIELDSAVWDDHEFWPNDFKKQVEAAQEHDLIDTAGIGFFWYTPDDYDVESLYELAKNSIGAQDE